MNVRLVCLLLALASPALVHATSEQTAPAERAAVLHPLKGIVVDVMTSRQALMVKHEEIPGVMRAMTMMFRVEPEVLEAVKKGDAIKGLMGRDEHNRWILRDVVVVAAAN